MQALGAPRDSPLAGPARAKRFARQASRTRCTTHAQGVTTVLHDEHDPCYSLTMRWNAQFRGLLTCGQGVCATSTTLVALSIGLLHDVRELVEGFTLRKHGRYDPC